MLIFSHVIKLLKRSINENKQTNDIDEQHTPMLRTTIVQTNEKNKMKIKIKIKT